MMKLDLYQKIGKKLILSGCTIFRTGVYLDSNGGVTGFQLGTMMKKIIMLVQVRLM